MTDFWYNNIRILIDSNFLLDIIPNKKYDIIRNLNAITRLSIYFSILYYLIYKDNNVFCLPLIVCVFTVIIYKNNKKNLMNELSRDINKLDNLEKKIEKKLDDNKRFPTINNPLMNFNLVSHDDKEALNTENPVVNDMVEDNLNYNVYKNPSDPFNREHTHTRFYTMPVTTVMNDQEGFARWCYTNDSSCKEGNLMDCNKKRGTTGGSGGGKSSS